MQFRQNAQTVGANLVGRIAVGRDSIGAGENRVNSSLLHQETRHIIADNGHFDAGLPELPGRQAGPLHQRSRLIGIDVEALAFVVRLVQHGKGGPLAGGGQGPGVAVGQDGGALADEPFAVDPDPSAHLDILAVDGVRLVQNCRMQVSDAQRGPVGVLFRTASNPVEGPKQIDGGRPRSAEVVARLEHSIQRVLRTVVMGEPLQGQHGAVSSGNTDGRRPANG